MHYSPTTGQVLPGYYYTGTGLWDTFRCLFPLLNLMYPSVSREMQEGFLNAYRESGFFLNGPVPAIVTAWWATTVLPSWPMHT